MIKTSYFHIALPKNERKILYIKSKPLSYIGIIEKIHSNPSAILKKFKHFQP